jgi:DNA gyrase subunit A
MIINKSGITIRMSIAELRIMGRATQGVRLIRLDDDDEIASVAKVEVDEAEKNVAMEANAAELDGNEDAPNDEIPGDSADETPSQD